MATDSRGKGDGVDAGTGVGGDGRAGGDAVVWMRWDGSCSSGDAKIPPLYEVWTWEGDAEVLPGKWASVMQAAYGAAGAHFTAEWLVVRLRSLPAFDPQGFFLMTYRGDTVGTVTCSRVGGVNQLRWLAVHPRHRRQGVARALVRLACARFQALGVGVVWAAVAAAPGAPARALLAAEGFAAVPAAGVMVTLQRHTAGMPPAGDVPPGYSVSTWPTAGGDAVGEAAAAAWTAVLAAAFGPELVADKTPVAFLATFAAAPAFDAASWFLVRHDATGDAVATAFGWVRPDDPPGVGTLHWVAVVPSHHRRGLAAWLTAAVTARLASRGFHTVRAVTQAYRAGALALYSRLGFARVDV